ncbi:MAG: DUF4329 domain-containing protein [Pseudomonadota bacterium]
MRHLIALTFLFLASCASYDPASIVMEPRAKAQTRSEIAFMSQFFQDIQPRSFAVKRELCGLVGVNAAGDFVVTEPVVGRASSCLPPDPRSTEFTVLASYHTHGAWHPQYLTEVPSFSDIRTDIEDGTDGYLATPGGRFWYIDARNKVARQICGEGCLPRDPGFRRDPAFPVQNSYTLDELRQF